MKYLSVQEMIEIEQAADRAGHSYAAMMEAAGRGLAEVIDRRFGEISEKVILALVGSGNNGGDALVALDHLQNWGWQTAAILFRERDPEDILVQRFLSGGGKLIPGTDIQSLEKNLKDWIGRASILLDGVLGTGIRLPLRPPLDHRLALAGELILSAAVKPTVVAVDCPSGVDCDSGEVSPSCLRADLTVTMAGVKQGILKFPAYEYVGELELVEIGLPADLPEWVGIDREVIQKDWVRDQIPERPINSHKGTFGTSLVIAGSRPYPGAAALAGLSAYRSGAGLVTLAVPQSIYAGLVETIPEATWVVLDDQEGRISESAVGQVRQTLGRPTACLLGPGFDTAQVTGKFLEGILLTPDLPPLIVDADGLRLLAGLSDWHQKLPAGSVLTPHPGEMAALSGLTIEEIQADRVGVAERFAGEWNQVLVLKGAHTVIAGPGLTTRILVCAEPALARAGSGDVLAGIICGLIAQGVEPPIAAAVGAWIHAKAGELALSRVGSPAAVLAGDISGSIGQVLGDLTSGEK